MPQPSLVWPLLSDILEHKQKVDDFSVNDNEIRFKMRGENFALLFSMLSKTTLDKLILHYNNSPNLSHTYNNNHEEHCASYVSSVIHHASLISWSPFCIIEKWQKTNQDSYNECVNFVLKKGTAQSISLLLNAAKGAISLNPNVHQRAIDEVLNHGNAQDISLLLNAAKGTISLNPKTHQRAIDEVLNHGNAQNISLLLNAAKGAISLNPKTHQRAIDKVLESGKALSIAMALNSSAQNAKVISEYTKTNPFKFDNLKRLNTDRLTPRFKSAVDNFNRYLGVSSTAEQSTDAKPDRNRFFASFTASHGEPKAMARRPR